MLKTRWTLHPNPLLSLKSESGEQLSLASLALDSTGVHGVLGALDATAGFY